MKIIILAAGIGSRMNQEKPKCACLINNKPMINHLLDTCTKLKSQEILVVVGYKKEMLIDVIDRRVTYIEQKEQLGTADAIKCCYEHLKDYNGDILIIPGDTPLIQLETLENLIKTHKAQKNKVTVLSTCIDNPKGYGRIKKENGVFTKIIEDSEITYDENQIKEINTGIYIINSATLFNNIYKIGNNNQKKEYYLTDIIGFIHSGKNIYEVPYTYHLRGINDYTTLKEIEGMLNN